MKRLFSIVILCLISNTIFAKNIDRPYGLFFAQKIDDQFSFLQVPTLKTEIDVNVEGLIQQTVVKQYYINPSKKFAEAIYIFPLPDKSAVDYMRMKIGDRYINGVIKEKVEAEEIYEQAKSEGKKTSLVSASKSNIFKTKVANIEPGELIVIEIRFQNNLNYENEEYSLRIPTNIIHRYLNKDQIISNVIQDQNNAQIDPDIHSPINHNKNFLINPYSININLNVGFDITKPKSNEDIIINKISSSNYSITLRENSMPSTKDFYINFKPIQHKDPYVQIYSQEYNNDLYLYGLINPQIELENLEFNDEASITVIADISGSMSGSSIHELKSTLSKFINNLPSNFLLNIVAFNDDYFTLFKKPQPLNKTNKLRALNFVSSFEATDGTEMLAPIHYALFEKTSLPDNHHIILMTDGAISHEVDAMAMVNEHINNKRFHVVGIGYAPNSFLVKQLAKTGRGSFIFSESSDLDNNSTLLLDKIKKPVLKDLNINIETEYEIIPNKLPDLLAKDPVNFFIKIKNFSLENLQKTIILEGQKNGKKWNLKLNKKNFQNAQLINKIWSKEKIDQLEFQNTVGALDYDTYKYQVTNLALENNLISSFTSFVAVEDKISRNDEDLISHQIAQNETEGWVDPQIIKISNYLKNNSIKGLNANFTNEHNDLLIDPMQINFVQTDTNKLLFVIMALILLVSSFILFRIDKYKAT